MSLAPLLEAARLAARLARRLQANIPRLEKDKDGSREVVTLADYGAQALLCRALSLYEPQAAVIAEESGAQFRQLLSPSQQDELATLLTDLLSEVVTPDQVAEWLDFGVGRQAARTWIVDPIDGTKGFVMGRHYAICAGLLEGEVITNGLMACPAYEGIVGGALFYADEGVCWREPLEGGLPEQVRVASARSPEAVRVVHSLERRQAVNARIEALLREAGLSQAQIRELDSMEKYALVACGEADILLRLEELDNPLPRYVWDYAAGVALVQAAGGVVTDIEGCALVFHQGAILPHRGFLVSSGPYHADLVRAARSLGE
ncbi:MAG: 3'(2'),5'-bisphosphate nucleotidase [Anaerolineae bacterium]|nr:3'(2'),5'-bisphosphate nucleotidase [Anaerolineae bacterium]MDW8173765.1 inositol monophosphatase family protein [Anaerolineae bacterium]